MIATHSAESVGADWWWTGSIKMASPTTKNSSLSIEADERTQWMIQWTCSAAISVLWGHQPFHPRAKYILDELYSCEATLTLRYVQPDHRFEQQRSLIVSILPSTFSWSNAFCLCHFRQSCLRRGALCVRVASLDHIRVKRSLLWVPLPLVTSLVTPWFLFVLFRLGMF